MFASRLCLLGSALLLAAGCASALVTPGETFPNIQAGLSVATNISTYTTSSQYVTVRAISCNAPPVSVPPRHPDMPWRAGRIPGGLTSCSLYFCAAMCPSSANMRLQVSWSGVTAPTNADGIALYVNAPNTTVNTLSPLKWQWANRSPGYALASGGYSSSGSLVCAGPPDPLLKKPLLPDGRAATVLQAVNACRAPLRGRVAMALFSRRVAETPRTQPCQSCIGQCCARQPQGMRSDLSTALSHLAAVRSPQRRTSAACGSRGGNHAWPSRR